MSAIGEVQIKPDIAPRFLMENRLVTVLCEEIDPAPAAFEVLQSIDDADSGETTKIFCGNFPLNQKHKFLADPSSEYVRPQKISEDFICYS